MSLFQLSINASSIFVLLSLNLDLNSIVCEFNLNKDVWAKAVTDAIRNGNDPAILVVFGNGNSKVRLMITEFEIMEQLIGEENE